MESPENQTHTVLDDAALTRLIVVLWMGVLLALAGTVAANTSGLLAAVGIGALVFLASFAVGSLLGFLFGVPRVLSREAEAAAPVDPTKPPAVNSNSIPMPSIAANAGSASSTSAENRLLQSNTNLERISDWLTTMLVGAGLVELHRANDALLGFRAFLTQTGQVFIDGSGNTSAGALPAVGPVILVFGAACGFLYMYLNTRLVLVRLFNAVEGVLAGKLTRSEQKAVRNVISEPGNLSSFIQKQYFAKQTLTIDDALSLMYDLLYKEDPDRVIELAAQLSGTQAVNRGEYWFYSAAAFGQKLHDLAQGTEDWESARDNALDCARRAVLINPAYRDRLWQISDPDSLDDDLAPLRDDPDFRRIVGREKGRRKDR